MKDFNHAFNSGMKQGIKDRLAGRLLIACPYTKIMGTKKGLLKYQAWVKGWSKSFLPHLRQL